jgi:hypothetical protein
MNRILLALAAAMVALLCACGEVVSLSPLASPQATVKDDGLIGRWRQLPGPRDNADTHNEPFELVAVENGYELRGGWKDDPGITIRMTLVQIGDTRYLDMTYAPGTDKRASDALNAGLPVHRISEFSRDGDRFTMRSLDFDRFKALTEEGKAGLAFVRLEEGAVVDRFSQDQPDRAPFQQIVITETTPRLQEWLARHAARPELWGEETVFERAPDPASR